MPTLGVNFTKMELTKTGQVTGKINIQNNVLITDVEKSELAIGEQKHPLLKVKFLFTVVYEPKVARMNLEGELLSVENLDEIDSLVKQWQKDKKLPKESMAGLLASVIEKANIEALILSRELGLPPPVQLPRVHLK